MAQVLANLGYMMRLKDRQADSTHTHKARGITIPSEQKSVVLARNVRVDALISSFEQPLSPSSAVSLTPCHGLQGPASQVLGY